MSCFSYISIVIVNIMLYFLSSLLACYGTCFSFNIHVFIKKVIFLIGCYHVSSCIFGVALIFIYYLLTCFFVESTENSKKGSSSQV